MVRDVDLGRAFERSARLHQRTALPASEAGRDPAEAHRRPQCDSRR